MTKKVLKSLSPPDNTIEIFLQDGVSGLLNSSPFYYQIEDKELEDILKGCDDDEEDDMIFFSRSEE